MPDLRIEIPTHVAHSIGTHTVNNPDGVSQLVADIVTHAAHLAVGDELGLVPEDFWTRVSICYANAPVVFVDVTMLAKDDRTPAIRKKLADGIKNDLSNFLKFDGEQRRKTSAGVLVWIHLKDPDADYAEVEPTK